MATGRVMYSVRDSLKEECLIVILQNFERYFAAFKLSEGTPLRKHFKYLERAFSETLFHRLMSCGKLKQEYFEFLINPHIQQLNLEGINEELIPGLLDRLQSVQNNITFLKAAFWNVKLNHYKQLISSIPNVEVIEVSDVVHPDVLKEIGRRCPLLRVLKILNCDIDDNGLRNVFLNVNDDYEDKIHLEHLDVSSTLVTSVGVSFVLSHAPSLKCVEYSNVPVAIYEKHKGDLENNCIEECKKYCLTSLSFPWEENMLDTLKVCSVLCPDVSSLTIDCLENDEQLLLCSRFHHLKEVKILADARSFSFESFTQFLKLRGPGLLSLHVEYGHISAEAIVEHCPKLHSLKLGSVHYEPLGPIQCLFSKAKLPCLRMLAVTYSNFSAQEAADSVKLILSNAKGIRNVDFSGSESLTENFVRSLFHLGLLQVQELNLSSSDVSVAPVVDLLKHGSLQKLFVSNCPNITEPEFFQLLSCKGEKDVSITLSDNESGDDSFDPEDYDDLGYNGYDYDFEDYEDYGYEYDFDDYEEYGYYYDCDCEEFPLD